MFEFVNVIVNTLDYFSTFIGADSSWTVDETLNVGGHVVYIIGDAVDVVGYGF